MPVNSHIPLSGNTTGRMRSSFDARTDAANLRQLTQQTMQQAQMHPENLRALTQQNDIRAKQMAGPNIDALEQDTKVRDYVYDNLGRVRDEASKQMLLQKFAATPELDKFVPPEFKTTPYDPAVYDGPTGLKAKLLGQKDQFAIQNTATDNANTAANRLAADADRDISRGNLEVERSRQHKQNMRDYETKVGNAFKERNVAFDKLTASMKNMESTATLFNEKGEPKKGTDALGILDNQMTYLIAKVLDPTGAVLTTDYANQVAGRSFAETVEAFMLKQGREGTIKPNERKAIFDSIKRFYAAQRDIVRGQAHEAKTQVWQYGGDPDNVGNDFGGVGVGWQPPARGGKQTTTPVAQAGAPAPGKGGSGYAGYTKDQVTAATNAARAALKREPTPEEVGKLLKTIKVK